MTISTLDGLLGYLVGSFLCQKISEVCQTCCSIPKPVDPISMRRSSLIISWHWTCCMGQVFFRQAWILVTLPWLPWISSIQMAQVLAWSMHVILIGHAGWSGTHRGQFGSLSLSIKTKDQGCFVGISAGNVVSGNAGHMIIPTNTNIQENLPWSLTYNFKETSVDTSSLKVACYEGVLWVWVPVLEMDCAENKFVKGKFSNFWYPFLCGKHISGVLDQRIAKI